MGLSVPILKVWLNDEISHYWLWLVIKMFIIPITTFGSTYSIIYNLWNNVRSSALWSLAIAVIYVGTSVALLELGVNMTAFLIIGAVAAIMQGAVLHIAIYSHIYPQSMEVLCLFCVGVWAFLCNRLLYKCFQSVYVIG